MKTRWTIGIACFVSAVVCVNYPQAAPIFMIGWFGVVFFLLHALEVKINRLLDDRDTRVSSDEINNS